MTTDNVKPGPGYIYVEMTIKDPEGFKQYTALSAPAVHAAGGRYIVRGVQPEFLEGSTKANRIVIVQFETATKAREFYHSAAYQAARQRRLSAAEFRMTLVEGRQMPSFAAKPRWDRLSSARSWPPGGQRPGGAT
jgi:uncharacterized protein (DUF1330 family)